MALCGGYVPVYDLSVIYAVVGSFKTNAELTLGGGFFPRNGIMKIIPTLLSSWISVDIRQTA